MPDRKEEIHIESFSWGATQTSAASEADALKAPPLGDAEQAAGGGPHVKVFDGTRAGDGSVAPADLGTEPANPEEGSFARFGDIRGESADGDQSIGGATGGVWKTTNFETNDPAASTGGAQVGFGDGSVRSVPPSPEAWELENVKITSYQLGAMDADSAPADVAAPDGGAEEAGTHSKWINVESVSIPAKPGGGAAGSGEHEVEYDVVAGEAAAAERSAPSVSEIVVTKVSDSASPSLAGLEDGETESGGGKMHMEDLSIAPDEPEPAVDIFLKLPDVNGEASDGAPSMGEGMVTEVSDAGAGDIPAGPVFLKLEGVPGESADGGTHVGGGGGGAGKVSWSDFSFDEPEDGPSSLASLEPGRAEASESPYLAVSLKDAVVDSYPPATDADGGTESVDDWEDHL